MSGLFWFIFRETCCCLVEAGAIQWLCLATCCAQKTTTTTQSFLRADLFCTSQHTITAVTGVKINYVSGWKSSYVRGVAVAVNITAAAHPMGPQSHWHGIISAQIRFICP